MSVDSYTATHRRSEPERIALGGGTVSCDVPKDETMLHRVVASSLSKNLKFRRLEDS